MTELIIATPCKTGQIFSRTAQCIANLQLLLMTKDIKSTWFTISNDPYVHAARDVLANRFLDGTKATHLLFIDDDVVFDPSDAIALLEKDVGVIAGVYPQKQIDFDLVRQMSQKYGGKMLDHVSCRSLLFLVGDEATLKIKDLNQPLEVAHAATGFMLIKREILEKYREKYPEKYVNSRYGNQVEMTPFFYLGIHGPTKESIGEDVMFCLNVADMGEKVYVLPHLSLGHIGFHEHHGCAWCASGTQVHTVKDVK